MNEANFNYENEFKYLLNRKILSRDEFLELLGQVKSVMERYHNSFSTLAQIEESERLGVEEIERIVKITLPVGKEWARDVAQAIHEAQERKSKGGGK